MLAGRALGLAVALSLVGGGPAADLPAKVDSDLAAVLAHRDRVAVIVALRPPRPARSFSATVSSARHVRARVLARIRPADGFRPTHRWDAVFAVPGIATRSGVQRLEADRDVVRVGLDEGGGGGGERDLALIRADVAQAEGATGKGVTVAVLDSGVDTGNPDLAGAVVAEHCFAPPSGCPNGRAEQAGAGSARDDHGHGTNVTGIITGDGRTAPVGVAPASAVVAVRVLDAANRFASTSQLVSGLNWIATAQPEVRVVNMSLGTDELFPGLCDDQSAATLALASAVATLRSRGAVIFASSMNNGSSSAMAAPACISGVVAVGAVYSTDFGPFSAFFCNDATTAPDRIACFSNSSSALGLLAPGVAVTSTALGGGTSTFTGTSQASPHAAGAAALLLGIDPTLTPARIEGLLKATGRMITDPRNGRTTPRIDVAAALDALSRPAPDVRVTPTSLNFGRVRIGRARTLRLSVRNVGRASLSITVSGRLAGFTVRPTRLDVPGGGAGSIAVTFRPVVARRVERRVQLSTNSPQHPQVLVRLVGTGVRR